MISAYQEHGQSNKAIQLYFQMVDEEEVAPNNITFISVLGACGNIASLDDGKLVHKTLTENGFESDTIIARAVVHMYGKCGDVNSAYSLFAKIQKRNIITWNAIISIYAQNGHIHDAIVVLKQMQERKVKPNSLTFIAILDACGESVALDEGQWIHAFIVDADIELNSSLVSTLINMYGKCGLLENAWKMYESFSEKNEVLMTTFMAVLAKHGHADSVFHLLFIMHDRGLKPNHVTFINILTACNYDGLVKVAYQLFVSMYNEYEVMPFEDHYICLVDILGRAGLLDQAEHFINIMPIQTPWLSLLHLVGACRQHMDIERGHRMVIQLLEIDSVNSSHYVIMSNIYALANQDFLCKI